jgi:V8-like Glu-specific endopeptidase
LEQLDERVVPSLTPVSPNAGYPFTAVVEVQVTFPDHLSYVGSGAMIDSYHVLTAGHMLYSTKDGGFATSIRVNPDMYGSRDPFGSAYGTYERVDPSWVSFNRVHPGKTDIPTSPSVEDMGLITLNTTIGNRTGWFGLNYDNNNGDFRNAYMQTAGYPADRAYGFNGQQMYTSAGRLIGTDSYDGLAFYQGNITIYHGDSGGPLWYNSPRGPVIYGVIAGADGQAANNVGWATRITQSAYNEIQSWRASDRVPPSAPTHNMTASVPVATAGVASPSPELSPTFAGRLLAAMDAPATSAVSGTSLASDAGPNDSATQATVETSADRADAGVFTWSGSLQGLAGSVSSSAGMMPPHSAGHAEDVPLLESVSDSIMSHLVPLRTPHLSGRVTSAQTTLADAVFDAAAG